MALGEAIEAGWLIEEAIEDPSRPLNLGSGFNQYWANRLGIEFLNKRRQQVARIDTRHRVRRIASLVDDFAIEFTQAAAVLDDGSLGAAAEEAAAWSAQLRGGKRTVHEVYADLKPLLGELRQLQTNLTIERMREG